MKHILRARSARWARIRRIPSPAVPGISDSARVRGGGDLVFLSGQLGLEEDGSVPGDFERAVELTHRELERALEAAGASFADVVRVNVYIAGLDQDRLMTWRRVRDRMVGTDDPPASTLIGVASLVYGALMEIDAIAAV
jgi:enamine deaminase RidA (YjgF/YER057c/UK114 family)